MKYSDDIDNKIKKFKIYNHIKNRPYNLVVDDNNILSIISDDKIIIKATYYVIGTYVTSNSMFYWADILGLVYKPNNNTLKKVNEIKKSKESLETLIINSKFTDNKVLEGLYYALNNSSIYLLKDDNDISVDMLIKYIMVTLDKNVICYGMDIINCYVLDKILTNSI